MTANGGTDRALNILQKLHLFPNPRPAALGTDDGVPLKSRNAEGLETGTHVICFCTLISNGHNRVLNSGALEFGNAHGFGRRVSRAFAGGGTSG